jgi:hypothetical protein
MVSPAGNPPCQSAWQFGAVFTGMVTEISDPGFPTVSPGSSPVSFPQKQVRIRISEMLTGLDPDQKEIVIETGLGGGDCGYDFRRGLDYIVYASKRSDGSWNTGICTPTRPVENAAEDLKYFHQLAQAAPTAEVRVTTWDVYGVRSVGAGGLPVLAGAHISIDGSGVHQTSTTDSTGRHVFSGLPPGEYTVDASLEGYASPDHPRPIKVQSKGCAEVALPLQLDRSVSGRLLGKDGLPVSGVTVEAVPTKPRYQNDLPWAADSATTDENGRYELRHLPTGDYYLGVSLSRTPTLQSPYARWFYPGSEDPAVAGIVHVSDKPEALRFDLTLPEQQHDRVISGTVFWPDGRAAEGVNILLEDPRWPWQTSNVSAATDKQGHFTVHVLDGTRYRVHANVFSNRVAVSAEPAPVNPGVDTIDVKLVLTRKGYSARDDMYKSLEDWRKGLGLR